MLVSKIYIKRVSSTFYISLCVFKRIEFDATTIRVRAKVVAKKATRFCTAPFICTCVSSARLEWRIIRAFSRAKIATHRRASKSSLRHRLVARASSVVAIAMLRVSR